MGNCESQFTNVPDLTEQWQNKERVDISVINNLHLSLQPHQMDQLKIGALQSEYIHRQINKQALHDTKALTIQKPIKIIPKKQPQIQIISKKQIQILDLNFYRSLGLEEYSYRQYRQQAKDYQGLQIYENVSRQGDKYKGEWKNGQPHGNGILTTSTRKYIGQFKNGYKHFHGRQIEKRQVYEGQFQLDRRKGFGIRYTAQFIEEGQFNDVFVEGKIRYKNGNIFQGTLKNGLFQGQKCKWYDSQLKYEYKGQFVKGKMTGYGILNYFDGKKYQGSLLDGVKHGYGKFWWGPDTFYEGQYQYNQKHGKGTLKLNGELMVGQFKNGVLDGQVVVTKGDQKTIKNYLYGRQVEIGQVSINEDGLPNHWR